MRPRIIFCDLLGTNRLPDRESSARPAGSILTNQWGELKTRGPSENWLNAVPFRTAPELSPHANSVKKREKSAQPNATS